MAHHYPEGTDASDFCSDCGDRVSHPVTPDSFTIVYNKGVKEIDGQPVCHFCQVVRTRGLKAAEDELEPQRRTFSSIGNVALLIAWGCLCMVLYPFFWVYIRLGGDKHYD
jgi:hypothetical protein